LATNIEACLCDPQSPRQRGSKVTFEEGPVSRKADIRFPLEKPKKPILDAQDGRGQHRRASAAPICAKLFWLVRLRERIVRRREFIALVSSAAAIQPLGARAERPPERVLYFTYSAGYRHDAISLSKVILTQLGRNSGAFEVTATEDTSEFSTENLERYAAVMFYTTGELPMSGGQKAALLNFVRSGRGFLGVHSATDTFYAWPDYLDLIGGYFDGHPWHQVVTIEVADAADPVVALLGNSLQLNDEIYQISDFDYRGSRVLLRLDQSSVDLGRTGVHQRFYGWPPAWKRSFGEGRVFYTALGHEASVWQDPRYQRLLTNAVLWSTRRSP
jgi:type 1 glutamine amidotransferase